MGSLDKIYLVGMPGAGKTTLGKALARELSLSFIDLDKKIEDAEKSTISDLFELKGEAYFREVENALLRSISKEVDSFVMATGGGAPCFYNAIDFMLKLGRVIYLNIGIDLLAKRVLSQVDTRPKFNDSNVLNTQISELLNQRQPIYERAHITIKGEDITVEKVLGSLKS